MANRIKLPKVEKTVIELGEEAGDITEYRLKPVTLQVEEELSECERQGRKIEENPDSKPLDLCEAELAQLDVVLEPVPRPGGDSKVDPPPSAKLLGQVADPTADPPVKEIPGYKTGAVTRAQIRALVEQVTAATRPM